MPGALSALEALCDYALYKSTFTLHLHYITFAIIAGPTTWNSLPTHLRRVENGTVAFGRLLKTHLFFELYSVYSALWAFGDNALQKSTFYLFTLLTYLFMMAKGL